jgi:beta-glucuronidase
MTATRRQFHAPMLALLGMGCIAAQAAPPTQNAGARNGLSLDGDWHIIVDPYENGYYDYRYGEKQDGYFLNRRAERPSDLVEYDFSTSPTLRVPGDWNSQDDKLFWYEGTIWYERDFDLSKRKDKRYLLHFGAVNYEAVVYVNGVRVGHHEGGFTPFEFDVTDRIEDGHNFVVVKVDDRRERDNVPTVNTDWWNYGGITRPVRLLELDAAHVADYSVLLAPDAADAISGWVRAAGTATGPGSARLAIAELGVDTDVVLDEQGYGEFRVAATPELWSPERPKLYEVRLRYGGDEVSDRIGFRRIETRGEDILLNGEPVYLRGVSIHEEAPLRPGRAWSAEDARQTLTWAKELGCNFVRLAHYPHNEAMLRMADEMGLMVWSEIPVYWMVLFDNDAVYAKAEQQLDEMIERDRNRASVILWSVANETPNSEARFAFLDRLVKRARSLDPSRLITAATDTQTSEDDVRRIEDPLAGILDVIGVNNYCGWYRGRPQDCAKLQWRSDYGKPVIVSEFGAGALQGKHGPAEERWTEEYQADVYKYNLIMLEHMPFVRGATAWILKDFRSPRRPLPGIQDYWNRKGLLSEKGARKQAWYVLHEFYEKKASLDD